MSGISSGVHFSLRHFSSAMAQHLSTVKIRFIGGGFSGTKCTKIVFVFGRRWATLRRSLRTPSRLGGVKIRSPGNPKCSHNAVRLRLNRLLNTGL